MKLFLLIIISLLFSGCSQPDSKSSLLDLQKKVSVCMAKDKTTGECESVRKQYKLLRDAALSLQKNPQQFGINVLHLQTKLIELKSKKTSSIEIKNIEKEIERNISLIAFFESPN